MKDSIVILAGGGPAPGINTVISTVAKTFLKDGYRVLGLHDGYKNLFKKEKEVEELDFIWADDIQKQGGSALRMSRYKPKNEEFNTDFFVENNIKLLVTIGGDDTASTANRISKYLRDNDVHIQNIHVPKTIDNDLPLPDGNPTFGYYSAKDAAVRLVQTVYEDARTSGNWFVLSAMGREAGHLAFGMTSACHCPMVIIPEMFNKTDVTLDAIVNLMVSSIVKRKLLGVNYGVIIISEGVFHFMTDQEIEKSGVAFTYDEHGHPELGNVSKAHIFNLLLQQRMKLLGINVKSRPVEIGYGIRCVQPNGYDLTYCSLLGYGVKKLFDKGVTGAMVTTNPKGEIIPLFLKDVEDENGKIKPRLVNLNGPKAELIFNEGLQYISPADYEAAKQYLPNPEEYDFRKILNW
ncbi:MAG: 6-phosphofructokinase [Bacteroidales bacterium]|nr:6-phosphofructokinase [Bacteroidales bacterium]